MFVFHNEIMLKNNSNFLGKFKFIFNYNYYIKYFFKKTSIYILPILMSKNVECVKVVVRCRPLSSTELQDGRQVTLSINTAQGEIHLKSATKEDIGERTFTFDIVYDWNSKQETVYSETAYPIVESVLEGYNGTVFAYGQTGYLYYSMLLQEYFT